MVGTQLGGYVDDGGIKFDQFQSPATEKIGNKNPATPSFWISKATPGIPEKTYGIRQVVRSISVLHRPVSEFSGLARVVIRSSK
jgi:hypothetical protein